MSKKYEELRPFNLEAAKAGAPICYRDGDIPTSWFIHEDVLYAEWESEPERFAQFKTNTGLDRWRMAPLCWVEGKPVYSGDVLYWTTHKRVKFTAGVRMLSGGLIEGVSEMPAGGRHDEPGSGMQPANLTWVKPATMVKKEAWINIHERLDWMAGFHAAFVSHAFTSEAVAKKESKHHTGYIKTVRIEWEEEA